MTAVSTNAMPTSLNEQEVIAAYDKIISIRDEVFAKKSSALDVSNRSATLSNAQGTAKSHATTKVPLLRTPNGTSSLSQVSPLVPQQPPNLHVPNTGQQSLQPTSPNAQKLPIATSGLSGIDPIFLTKSDVLVRAEIYQKRQRIEKILEEQVHRAQRQRGVDQDALPDFDVTDILKKAQDLVKPIQPRRSKQVNGAASSNDSFDENTLYSSQMDESTTTEEAEESGRKRPRPICNFFLRGETCRYGRTCTFSHDPALKQKLEAESSRKGKLDRNNTNDQGPSRSNYTSDKHIPASQQQSKPSMKETNENVSGPHSQAESEAAQRVARLEAELRIARAEQAGANIGYAKVAEIDQDELADLQSGADEFGRDVALREQHKGAARITRSSARREANRNSPIQADVRIVTNHIRSPVAPQPSRVSPLAVAKVPQVSQIQRDHVENGRFSRASHPDISSSPHVGPTTRNSKKRRRGRESGEQMRNVAPRTDQASPNVRIKEEPQSPPPFSIANPDVRRVRPRQEAPQPMYVDTAPVRNRHEDPIMHRPRLNDQPTYNHADDDRGPHTPVIRRVISRNGQHQLANEEKDLRRVVTAPRQVRAPMSPALHPVQYSAPQPRATRAASQFYVSPTSQYPSDQYKTTIQSPRTRSYVADDQPPSPIARRRPQSPQDPYSVPMAPPPPRIVMDKYGNRFIEAPVPVGRHESVAPLPRGYAPEPRYEQLVPRSASVLRQPQILRIRDDGRRASSPSVQQYYEVAPRHIAERETGLYQSDPYVEQFHDPRPRGPLQPLQGILHEDFPVQDPRIIRMESVRPPEREHDGLQGLDERFQRMPSIRPTLRDFQDPQEDLQRVQSVRPEQPRIVPLGERREFVGQTSRQASVLPANNDLRGPLYATENQPRYGYAPQLQQGGYIEEIQDEGGYEAPGSAGRRVTQRF